ncbi:MAG: hypothetical protein M3162_00470 [Thermoproteota archaeon]|nr:hypothetical protein [Thermoproteota archaeon]
MIFNKNKENGKWKLEYYDSIYKIYDWDRNLAGYFMPEYEIPGQEISDNGSKSISFEEENEIIEKMNKEHQSITGGNIMLPMLKLGVLDNNEGLNLDYVITSFQENIKRAERWRSWLMENQKGFSLVGSAVYTAREDRTILSIVIGIESVMVLGEKELLPFIKPLLNKLHDDALI